VLRAPAHTHRYTHTHKRRPAWKKCRYHRFVLRNFQHAASPLHDRRVSWAVELFARFPGFFVERGSTREAKSEEPKSHDKKTLDERGTDTASPQLIAAALERILAY
jgi:hypothetical protein